MTIYESLMCDLSHEIDNVDFSDFEEREASFYYIQSILDTDFKDNPYYERLNEILNDEDVSLNVAYMDMIIYLEVINDIRR